MTKEQLKMLLDIVEDYLSGLQEIQVLSYPEVYVQWRIDQDWLILDLTCMQGADRGYHFQFQVLESLIREEDREGRFYRQSMIYTAHLRDYQYQVRYRTLKGSYLAHWQVTCQPVQKWTDPNLTAQIWGHLQP